MKYFHVFILVVLIGAGFCISCTQEKAAQPVSKTPAFVLAGDEEILAKVNGSPITKYELEQVIESTFGKKRASTLDEMAKKNVLESIVASRALALAFEKEMTPEEKAVLEKKIGLYREQLLVQRYLKAHATPEPVTSRMVQDYYNKYPERFGASLEVTYEMIASKSDLTPKDRNRVVEALKQDSLATEEWGIFVNSLRENGLPVIHKKGRASKEILGKRLYSLIENTPEGSTSNLTFIDGASYVVRVVKRHDIPPRPLSEVSARIRKSLVPVQLKRDVKEVSVKVLSETNVEYL